MSAHKLCKIKALRGYTKQNSLYWIAMSAVDIAVYTSCPNSLQIYAADRQSNDHIYRQMSVRHTRIDLRFIRACLLVLMREFFLNILLIFPVYRWDRQKCTREMGVVVQQPIFLLFTEAIRWWCEWRRFPRLCSLYVWYCRDGRKEEEKMWEGRGINDLAICFIRGAYEIRRHSSIWIPTESLRVRMTAVCYDVDGNLNCTICLLLDGCDVNFIAQRGFLGDILRHNSVW